MAVDGKHEPVFVASGPGNTIWFTEDGVPSIGVIQAEPEGLRAYRDVTAPETTSGRRASSKGVKSRDFPRTPIICSFAPGQRAD